METLSALQRVVYDSAPWAGTAMALALLTKSSRFIGWLGERRLRIATYFQLDKRSYHRFHDVLLRSPDGTTQIDHVVISAQGVFVIETKTMKGWIFGNERERNWTQKLRRQTFTFMNPLRQNYKHVKAVQEALDLAPEVVHSVVVFAGRAKFKTLMPANVIRLRDFVRYIRSTPMVVFNDEEVRTLVVKLKRNMISSRFARWAHVNRIKTNRRNPKCPRCGAAMQLRTARKGCHSGSEFWGCNKYPQCRGVRAAA
jgi:restriction system protein